MLSEQKNQDPTLGKIANRLCLVPAVQDATHRKSRPWWQAIPVLKESCNSKTRKKARQTHQLQSLSKLVLLQAQRSVCYVPRRKCLCIKPALSSANQKNSGSSRHLFEASEGRQPYFSKPSLELSNSHLQGPFIILCPLEPLDVFVVHGTLNH